MNSQGIAFHEGVSIMVSILRRAQLEYCKGLSLSGDLIDLGAKSANNQYFNLIDNKNLTSCTFVDYFHKSKNLVSVDFEKSDWDIDKKFDVILAFNVLEHVYNYENFLLEANKIARKGCKLIIVVPFLYRFHKDPNDFHRYTHEALEMALKKTGWHVKAIKPTLSGRFSLMCSLWEGFLPKVMKNWLQSISIFLDKQLSKKLPSNKEDYALGYTVEANKQ